MPLLPLKSDFKHATVASATVQYSGLHQDWLSMGRLQPLLCVLAPGLQAILPEYLRARFVQAALSYIGCNEEGQFMCRDNDCWCQCSPGFPQCNCPAVDLRAMEASLLHIREAWNLANQDFEESGRTHDM